MNSTEKKVKYTTTNTYETLNKLTPETKHIWLVFHGIGFLSRYFLRYFDELNPTENYIIAPQAPAKYYLKNEYKHVGASWLTKEQTSLETENVIHYINAVLKAETLPEDAKLIIFGFSQGVSIATRFIANTKTPCKKLVLYAGGIPNELNSVDFSHLLETNTTIDYILGTKDDYLTKDRMNIEYKKLKYLFRGRASLLTFKGGHELKKELINNLVK